MIGCGFVVRSRYRWAISARMNPLQDQQRTRPVRTISPQCGQDSRRSDEREEVGAGVSTTTAAEVERR